MTPTTKLEPCPFCGSTNLKLFGESAPEWWVACKDCEGASRCHSQKNEAVAAWNRRSPAIAADRNKREDKANPAIEGLTSKQAWWAGYRAGKGLPPDTPRQEAIAAPVSAGLSDEEMPTPEYAKAAAKTMQQFMLQERFRARDWHPIGDDLSQDATDLAYSLDLLTEATAIILNFADRALASRVAQRVVELERQNADLMLALQEIAESKPLTATDGQTYRHLQKIAQQALEGYSLPHDIQQLCHFYDATTLYELAKAQADHVERLQETLHKFNAAADKVGGQAIHKILTNPVRWTSGDQEPTGWLYNGSYWSRDKGHVPDHVKEYGRPLYERPTAAIAADRNRREATTASSQPGCFHLNCDGPICEDCGQDTRPSAAPVSAGLSAQEILSEAMEHAEMVVGEYWEFHGKAQLIAFARALASRLLPEGWKLVPKMIHIEQVSALIELMNDGDGRYSPEQQIVMAAQAVIDAAPEFDGYEAQDQCPKCKIVGAECGKPDCGMIAAAPSEVQAKPRRRGDGSLSME